MPVISPFGRCLNDPERLSRAPFPRRELAGVAGIPCRSFCSRLSLVQMTSTSIARTPGGQRGRLRRFGRPR